MNKGNPFFYIAIIIGLVLVFLLIKAIFFNLMTYIVVGVILVAVVSILRYKDSVDRESKKGRMARKIMEKRR